MADFHAADLWVAVVPETSQVGPAMEKAGKEAKGKFGEAVRDFGKSIHDDLEKVGEKAKDVFSKAGTDAGTGFRSTIANEFKDAVSDITGALRSGNIDGAIDGVKTKMGSISDAVKNIGLDVSGWVPELDKSKTPLDEVDKKMSDSLKSVTDISSQFEGLPGKIGAAAGKVTLLAGEIGLAVAAMQQLEPYVDALDQKIHDSSEFGKWMEEHPPSTWGQWLGDHLGAKQSREYLGSTFGYDPNLGHVNSGPGQTFTGGGIEPFAPGFIGPIPPGAVRAPGGVNPPLPAGAPVPVPGSPGGSSFYKDWYGASGPPAPSFAPPDMPGLEPPPRASVGGAGRSGGGGGGLNLSIIPVAAQKYANDCIDASARIILSHSGINMTEDQLTGVIAPGGTIESQAAGLNRLYPAGRFTAMQGSGGSPAAMFNAIKASIDSGTGSILNVAPGSSIAGKPFSEGHFIAATGYNPDGTINLSDTARGTQYSVSATDAFQATRGRGIVAGTGSGPFPTGGGAGGGGAGGQIPTGAEHDPIYTLQAQSGAGGSSGSPFEQQGQELGQGLGKGFLQLLGLDGSVFGGKSPLDWGAVKLGMGALNWGLGQAKGMGGGGGPMGSPMGAMGGGGGGALGALTGLIPSPGPGISAAAVPGATPSYGIGQATGAGNGAKGMSYHSSVNMYGVADNGDAMQRWQFENNGVRPYKAADRYNGLQSSLPA